MQPKDLATIRVSNLSPGLSKSQLLEFLDYRNADPSSSVSLCPQSTTQDSSLVATVTFSSQSSAKQTLKWDGRALAGRNVSIERDFMGLTVLAAPKNPKLDIIAVHGLNGHAYGTWTHREDGNSGVEAMWLRDFLPNQVRTARILVYGYNSALLGSNTSVSNIKDFAHDLLQRIIDDRADKDETRPLIFICHSLGGIVVKQALVTAHARPERYRNIKAPARSILFLATPHGGSKSANIGSLLSHVASLAFQSPSKQLLETLKQDSGILSRLSQEFQKIHSSFDIVNFYERRKTPGLNSLIVDETSSRLGVESEVLIPIDATHRQICKYRSQTDPLFLPVLAQIQRCSAQNTQANEFSGEVSSTPMSVDGHFMVPVSPNPFFVGRTEQLQLLEGLLGAQDHDTRLKYPIVAVHGLGGVGKTQLATRFAYDRKVRKPNASVFWVSARNANEIESGFQEIAFKLSLARSADGRVSHTQPVLTAAAVPAVDLRIPLDGVDLLKGWMLTPGHEDWLLILDNFDDIQVKVDRFLPVGASGSVLITTRDRNIIGSVATTGFALTAMEFLDAERLFLQIQNLGLESNQQVSNSDPERQALGQILAELQCFPLAIDQAASFIRENSPMTFREYLAYLKPRSIDRERLLRFKQANPTYPDSVMTTWEISLQYLERTQPRAGWILQLLGFLDPPSISEKLLTRVTETIPWSFDKTLAGKQLPFKYRTLVAFLKNDVGFRVAIGTLVSLSLIQRHLSGPTLHVHPLVHEWTRVRLNSNPEMQANFTIVAALVLYHYLPSEVVIRLYYRPNTYVSRNSSERIDQVSHHIKGVLANLGDYAMHATNMPMECLMLCEIYSLASLSTHLGYPFDLFATRLEILDRTIESVCCRLPHGQIPFAYFLHRVILCLRGNVLDRLTLVNKMADSFESLQSKESLEKCPDEFFMLLASSVVNLCDTLNPRYWGKLRRVNKQYDHLKAADLREQHQRIRYRLLDSLRSLFSSIEPLSTLLRETDRVVKHRLLKVMTPKEFAAQKWFDMKQGLSPEIMFPRKFDERANFLCLLSGLLWGYEGPKNFPDLQNVFSTMVSECSSMRVKARQSTALRRDQAGIHAMSRSKYISSSFGREIISESTNKIDMDLITPFNDMWVITLLVAQTISDPRQQWKTSLKEKSHVANLDISHRRWSLYLVSSVSKVYKRVRADQGAGLDTDAQFLNHFEESRIRHCLINIYANLEDFELLQRELVIVLQCDEVLRYCNTLRLLPWESQPVASAEEDSSSPTAPHAPQQKSQENYWPFLGIGLFKHARDLVTGQLSPDSGEPGPSSKPSFLIGHQEPDFKMSNAAASIACRLKAAASQQVSRAPAHRSYKRSNLEYLGLPDSCNCVADPHTDGEIAHFFTLAQKKEIIDEEETNNLRLKIDVVASLSPGSSAKYLGNLEIIYQLAQKLSAKFPEAMDAAYASNDEDAANTSDVDSVVDESNVGSSEDEMTNEMDNKTDFDFDAGMAQDEWGW